MASPSDPDLQRTSMPSKSRRPSPANVSVEAEHPALIPIQHAPSFIQRQLLTLKYTQTQEFLAERRRTKAAALFEAGKESTKDVASDGGALSPTASPAASRIRSRGSPEAVLSLSDALLRRKTLMETEEAEEEHDLTWRLKLGHFVEGHWVQLAVVLLIFVDVVAVVAEIMLSSVAGSELVDEATGQAVPVPAGLKIEPLHRVHTWETALHWVSLSILIVFLLQQLLLMVAYGLGYFKRIFNVLDLIIIITALVLEVLLHNNDSPGLIAILLSWRIVRVIHGFIASAETTEHERHALLHRIEHEKRWHLLDLSYWMTTLRVMSFKFAARTIQRWWLDKPEASVGLHLVSVKVLPESEGSEQGDMQPLRGSTASP